MHRHRSAVDRPRRFSLVSLRRPAGRDPRTGKVGPWLEGARPAGLRNDRSHVIRPCSTGRAPSSLRGRSVAPWSSLRPSSAREPLPTVKPSASTVQLNACAGILSSGILGVVQIIAPRIRTKSDTPGARFWRFVDRGHPWDCWPWKGHLWLNGYGCVRWEGRRVGAHRVAFLISGGTLEPGLVVMHTCDNPRCCNPAHLRQGTDSDNIRDSIRKGRWPQIDAWRKNFR